MSEAVTRFEVTIRPQDGSGHVTLTCDYPGVVACRVADTLVLSGSHTTEVFNVAVSPGCEPVVWVIGRSLYPFHAAEAAAMVRDICEGGRWVASGDD